MRNIESFCLRRVYSPMGGTDQQIDSVIVRCGERLPWVVELLREARAGSANPALCNGQGSVLGRNDV